MTFFRQYSAPIIFSLLLAGALALLWAFFYKGTQSINRGMGGIEQSHQIIVRNQELAVLVERMTAQQQAYVLSGEERFNAAYDFNKGQVSNRIADLNALMRQNTAQVSRLNELQHHFLLLTERLDEMALVSRAERAQAARSERSREQRKPAAAGHQISLISTTLITTLLIHRLRFPLLPSVDLLLFVVFVVTVIFNNNRYNSRKRCCLWLNCN